MLIIGVGNEMFGDDGAGALVARRMTLLRLPGLRAITHNGEGLALMEAWQNEENVIVVDAAVSGAEPGSIHRFDCRARQLPFGLFRSCSSHAFGVAEAVALARTLKRLPPRLMIYGIESRTFLPGARPSAPVYRAALEVVREIRDRQRTTDHRP